MKAGIIKFKLVDMPSEKKPPRWDLKTGVKMPPDKSPYDIQMAFLRNLREQGFEPFDSDDQGFQYWRRA